MAVIKPNSEGQMLAMRSNADIVILGGGAGTGKSAALSLVPAYKIAKSGKYRALFLRKNLEQAKAGGSIIDTYRDFYSLRNDKEKDVKYPIGSVTMSQNPNIYFDNGAKIDFTHVADEDTESLEKRFKSRQYDDIFIDEADAFSDTTVFYLLSRLRGKTETKHQLYISQNPERECWVRKMCGTSGGNWIDDNGWVINENNGRVMFMFMTGKTTDSIIWGKTKEEVYQKCSQQIDHLVSQNPKKRTPEKMILSCVFISWTVDDNESLMDTNANYLGLLAASGASSSLLENNWNYSKYDNKATETTPITHAKVVGMVENMAQKNGEQWITCDPAGEGEDNFVMIHWNGFHADDLVYYEKTNPNQQIQVIKQFLNKHNLGAGALICDYGRFEHLAYAFPAMVKFRGGGSPTKKGKLSYAKFKVECADLLVKMIDMNLISIDPKVANIVYTHQMSKTKDTTVMIQLSKECGVLTFKENAYHKLDVENKGDMGHSLGGKSQDILDNFIMRIAPSIYEIYELFEKGIGESKLANKQIGYDDEWDSYDNSDEDTTTWEQFFDEF